jgi:uncharacterized protein DUF6962
VIRIRDPDVVFTDLGLALLGGFFAWRLRRGPFAGAILMAGLASAAFWGAVFHALFPGKTATTGGYLVWMLVALSIVVVTGALLWMAIRLGRPDLHRRVIRRWAVGYAVVFAVAVAFVDVSFRNIVRFYAPVLLVTMIVTVIAAARTGSRAWSLIALGLALSGIAAVQQQAGVALHATYFDHNAVYHVIQAAALAVLYAGFARRTSDER